MPSISSKESTVAGDRRRPLGLRLIIGYKLVKAPLMLALAVWLMLAPHSALRVADAVIEELGEQGPALARLADWLGAHVSLRMEHDVTLVAWGDGLSTAFEAVCLLTGKAWGEWVVIGGLAVLIPAELDALIHRPTYGKGVVLVVNILIVAYLLWRRVKLRRRHLRHQRPVPA